jgi:photosystem II stability/assembly factor-like uncharacterized protein
MKVKQILIIAFSLSLVSIKMTAQQWAANPKSANLLPYRYSVTGMKIVNKDIIWATASLATGAMPANHTIKILRTTNGGQSWRVMNVNGTMGRLGFDIEAFDSTTAWISTYIFNGNDPDNAGKGLFKTTDGGQTWTQKLPDSVGGFFVRFSDRNEGVCMGNSRRFAYTSDGGDNWTFDTLALKADETPSIAFSATNSLVRQGDTLWFGTRVGRIFRSINKGRNWTPFATGIPVGWFITSVAFADSQNGMLVGIDTFKYKFAGLAKTNDGGLTWQTVPMTLVSSNFGTAPLLATIPSNKEKIFLLGTENLSSTSGVAFLTSDQGGSWIGVEKNINSHGACVFLSPEIGWIGNGFVDNAKDPTTMFQWRDDGLFSPTTELYDNTFFSISPNPTQDVLNLQFEDVSNEESFDAHISDVAGRIVFQTKTSDKQLIIKHLQSGIYFLTVKTKGKIGVVKFIKN